MFRCFFRCKKWRYKAYGGSGLIVALLVLQTELALIINEQNKKFYEVWSDPGHHYLSEGYSALLPFLWSGIVTAVLIATTSWFNAKFVLWWRKAMTYHYVELARVSQAKIEAASQRITEDVDSFTKNMQTIALTVVSSIFTLIAFGPILWTLSSRVQMPILSAIPGSLVWVCFLTGIVGFLISWFFGSWLPGLVNEYKYAEAAYRTDLVYCEANPQLYAKKILHDLFESIYVKLNRLYRYTLPFDLWKHFYLMHVWMVPFVILASGLFLGPLSFGVLMQVNDAFSRLLSTVTQFIQNWGMITDLRGLRWRLRKYEWQVTTPQLVIGKVLPQYLQDAFLDSRTSEDAWAIEYGAGYENGVLLFTEDQKHNARTEMESYQYIVLEDAILEYVKKATDPTQLATRISALSDLTALKFSEAFADDEEFVISDKDIDDKMVVINEKMDVGEAYEVEYEAAALLVTNYEQKQCGGSDPILTQGQFYGNLAMLKIDKELLCGVSGSC